ncbi:MULTISPECIES: AzlD domain-containing protein [Halomonadaceae]|uniref:AzlD domain-containing protein n=1 Tax=Halomonadaceae TaxID=28256 RepID=UPI00159751D5|nr:MULTISPECIES: AzlD domain-containing protein [Halomonas]QJQ96543.1 hypothetical protein HIO72_15560 [Halomonas sp. PA5]
MSVLELVMVIVAAGVGTYLIRYVPLVFGRRLASAQGFLARVLAALGVAAIASLIALSLWGLWWPEPDLVNTLRLFLGCATVLALLRLTGNIGLATLSGALAYGVLGPLLSF